MTVHFLDDEVHPVVADLFIAHGNLSEEIEDEAAEGIEIFVGDIELELLVEIPDVHSRIAEVHVLPDLEDILALVVELVLYVADDFLDDVLEADYTRDAPVLVDGHRNMDPLPAHFAQQRVETLAFGDEVRLADNPLDVDVLAGGQVLDEVLCIENPDDVIDGILVHRKSGEAATVDGLDQLLRGVFETDEGGVDSRHHDLLHGLLRETQHTADHVLLLQCQMITLFVLLFSAEELAYELEVFQNRCSSVN